MLIGKQCRTLKEAEQHQNRLYEKYDYVRLVQSPMFSEGGLYKWEVRKKAKIRFQASDKDKALQAKERFNHDVCIKCRVKSVPAEKVVDQSLRGCPNCGEVWFEDLERPVRKH